MNIITKVIVTSKEEIKEKLIERLNLILKENNSDFEIYSGIVNEEQVTLSFYKVGKEKETIEYLKNNYEIIKILYMGFSNILNDLDLKFGDIVIPNAFTNEENDGVFIEYVVDSNYDLNKFGLIMNGICLTIKDLEKYNGEISEIIEKYYPDIIDNESFFIFNEIKNSNLVDKSVGIKLVISNDKEENKEILENLINIGELIL